MEMTLLEMLAVISAGMMTGNELCVSIFHAQVRRLDDRTQFGIGQRSAVVFGKFMPFWYAATLLLSGAAAYALRGTKSAALVDTAAALFLVSIVYTVTLLVPINNRVAGWTWDTRPAEWKATRQTWDTRHFARVVLLFAALVCLVYACLLGRT